MALYGAIEAGGTKMVCAICDDNGNIIEKASFPTQTPEETLPVLAEYFRRKDIVSLGIGCFGPIDLDTKSVTYGSILKTPKIAWQNVKIVSYFEDALKVPVGFDTDVNGSMLGEATFGATKDVEHAVYITIGTGIGIGVMINRSLHHGMLHPEGGHIRLMKRNEDTFGCHCPFHDNCFEGLCSGPALQARYGISADKLKDRIDVWELEADYIAQAIVNYIFILSPQRIILGGGVMHQKQLFPIIRKKVQEYIGGYVNTSYVDDLDTYISQPGLGDDQGIIGAALLGKLKLEGK